MAESMGFISMSKGEAVAFDSFEPHMSGPQRFANTALGNENCLRGREAEDSLPDPN